MKRYNFKNFLKDYKVEIPILQRDYVQGRRDQKSIATKFLNTLFEVLNGERGKLHLDFIYGYEKDKKFIPIDGQQRITTLWLLHLYLYKLASKLDTVDQRTCKSVRDILKNFTYSVRTGSKDFCKALVLDSEKKFENSLKSQTIRPSKAIRDASSAFGGLKNLDNDPTIGAMLCMLDLIYDHCCNKYECCSESKEKNKKGIARLKKNLKNLENITFDVFNMGKFELGEDLYIKMNARGKQLSPYENLKAFMEEKLNIKDHAQLLRHIENKWSDYFFEGEPEKFDIGGLRFLHYANIFFKYSQGINKVDDSDDIHNLDRPVGEFYAPLQDIENIRSLDRVMNILKKNRGEKFFKFEPKFSIKLEHNEICHFFSLLALAETNQEQGIGQQALTDYLRVSKHLIENCEISTNDIEKFSHLLKFISEGCHDKNIYEFLSLGGKSEKDKENEENITSFHRKIYLLEKRKAMLIKNDREREKGFEDWENILNLTSDHYILCGWVDFLLDFSDEKFDGKIEPISQSSEPSKYQCPNLEKFQQYAHLTMLIYSEEFLKEYLALFQRAFLCMGDYSFYQTNYFYGHKPTKHVRDQEATNRLLSGSQNKEKLPYFQHLLDEIIKVNGIREAIKRIVEQKKEEESTRIQGELIGMLKKRMEEIVKSYMESDAFFKRAWWDQLLIRQKGLFEFLNEKQDVFERTRRIAFKPFKPKPGDLVLVKVSLLQGVKDSSSARDLLGYGFYLYCREKGVTGLSAEYTSNSKKDEDYYKSTHFKIGDKHVFANSQKSEVKIGENTYPIDLDNVFGSFDKILEKIPANPYC